MLKQVVDQVSDILNNKEKLDALVEQRFKEADKDNSGFINRSELKWALTMAYKNAGAEAPDETFVDNFLQMLDDNGSGTLQLEEFRSVVVFSLQKLRSHYQDLINQGMN